MKKPTIIPEFAQPTSFIKSHRTGDICEPPKLSPASQRTETARMPEICQF